MIEKIEIIHCPNVAATNWSIKGPLCVAVNLRGCLLLVSLDKRSLLRRGFIVRAAGRLARAERSTGSIDRSMKIFSAQLMGHQ